MNTRQIKFCQLYASTGNATMSYKKAGYKSKNPKSDEANASRLIRNDKIASYLKELSKKTESSSIMTIKEVKEFWTKIAQSDEEKMLHRIKATELLVKSEGGFLDVQRVEGEITVKKGLNDFYDDVNNE